MQAAHVSLPWSDIDTVLLDMDGTLLDLHFDNFFWLDLVPRRYAQQHGLTFDEAKARLTPRFAATQGTLAWYCTDHWSQELNLDIAALKHEMRSRVRFLPGAELFLASLRRCALRTVLVTNAHPDSLEIKASHVGLPDYFEETVSSHRFGAPKEHDVFWTRLHDSLGYVRERTLFIDDSLSVLRAARRHGIAHLIAINHPDTTLAPRVITEFPAVARVADLLSGENRLAARRRDQLESPEGPG